MIIQILEKIYHPSIRVGQYDPSYIPSRQRQRKKQISF